MVNKKIIILPVPAMGHINPILAFSKRLIEEDKMNIIIFGIEDIKSKIESTGSTYVNVNFQLEKIQRNLSKSVKAVDVFPATASMMYEAIDKESLNIANFLEKEKPDIVIYDNMSVHAKWALRILKKRSPNLIPKIVIYHPQYAHQKGVFPNTMEEQIMFNMNFYEKLKFLYFGIKLTIKSKMLSRKLNIEFCDVEKDFKYVDTSVTNIVFMFPALQARSELLHENIKLVGACIDDGPHLEDLRNVNDEPMKEFLQKFQPKNPTSEKSTENFLIYVSLGSLFTNNFEFYLKVIEALKQFISKVKSETLFAIINVGNSSYDEFKKKNYNIPNSIKLVPFAPQLEILKRASIFLTHCGMNSTSESIWFGVPMICMPVTVDQPLVAHRVSKELGLGILLDINKFKVEELVKSFHKIYSDETIQKKAFEYSQTSQKYNGNERTIEIIKNIL
jgi:UDP:flavonoid glycosyltransferase YjiC (YdhE family)